MYEVCIITFTLNREIREQENRNRKIGKLDVEALSNTMHQVISKLCLFHCVMILSQGLFLLPKQG